MQPVVAWSNGQYHHMPIMGGTTKDEITFTESIRQYFAPGFAPLTAEEYTAIVNRTVVPPTYVEGAAAQALAEYPPGPNPQATYNRVATDPFKCRTLHVLELQAASNTDNPVWGWDFTYRNAPYYFPEMPNPENPSGNFLAKASHTIDIQFLFPNWHGGNLGVNLDQFTGQPRELQGAEITLSDQLVAAWTNFAATGNPNDGLPEWPEFTTGSSVFSQQDIPISTETEEEYRAAYNCDFWDPLIVYITI